MAKLGKEDWVSCAFEAFAAEGIQGVRVEPLAKALGVSKGSFYWHFQNRGALLTEMLETWERGSTLDIIETVEEISDDPMEKLRALGEIVFRPNGFDRVEANLRTWAATYPPAAERCARVDERRIGYVTKLLQGCGFSRATAAHRADLLYLVLIGNTTRLNAGGEPMRGARRKALLEMLLARPVR